VSAPLTTDASTAGADDRTPAGAAATGAEPQAAAT
jgi:hypothetical protein